MPNEEIFYNALAICLENNYTSLRKRKEKLLTWESAWKAEGSTSISPSEEWKKLEDNKVQLILRTDPLYPEALKHIPHPPHALYIRGLLPKPEDIVVAIVGTRRATPSGKEASDEFASQLAAKRLVIASGLAFGVDAAAHSGTLSVGGRTIAVLANGLGSIYPKTNASLGERIVQNGGALISEYTLNASPLPHRFLERNRIISGLSRAILVIEAPSRSGSLATARFALDQNRDIFVLPGPATHPNFKGSHALIRAGGTLVTSPEEMLSDMGIEAPLAADISSARSPEEVLILEVLKDAPRPLAIDEILEKTTLDPRIANQKITTLLLEGIIREEDMGYAI